MLDQNKNLILKSGATAQIFDYYEPLWLELSKFEKLCAIIYLHYDKIYQPLVDFSLSFVEKLNFIYIR